MDGNGRFYEIARVAGDDAIDLGTKRGFHHHGVLEIGDGGQYRFTAIDARRVEDVEQGEQFIQYIAGSLIVMRMPVHEIVDVGDGFRADVAEIQIVRGCEKNILCVLCKRFPRLQRVDHDAGINECSHILFNLSSRACSKVMSAGITPNRDLAISTRAWNGFVSLEMTLPLRVIYTSSVAESSRYLLKLFFSSVAVIDILYSSFIYFVLLLYSKCTILSIVSCEFIGGERKLRIIPKKIKVKNTVWKCYSMPDVIVALAMFALIFAFITLGNWVLAVIFGIVSVVMFMPTQEGIFYACILENVRFLFSKKKYMSGAKSAKESVDALIPLKGIKENGLIEYAGGSFGRVIKIGQKNFGIEDEVQQNIDINYFANALKLIDGNQSADIVKIDRPVNLDAFAGELFGRLNEVRENTDTDEVKKIKDAILKERIDAIDRLNNIRKQYISDYYIVLYGRNELDLKNTAVNVSSEINKCGLNTKLLDKRKTAVFLKYNYSRNFDEREVKDLSNEETVFYGKLKKGGYVWETKMILLKKTRVSYR